MKLTRETIMADHEKRVMDAREAVPVLQGKIEALQVRIALLEARPVVPSCDSTWHDPTILYGPLDSTESGCH